MLSTQSTTLHPGNVNSTDEHMLVCGMPCTFHVIDDITTCVRLSDGFATRLSRKEAYVLSRLSSVKSLSEWLNILCREDLELSFAHGPGKSLLRWSLAGRDNTHESTLRKAYGPLYKRYLQIIESLMGQGLVIAAIDSTEILAQLSTFVELGL
jgi:hypothetical protein